MADLPKLPKRPNYFQAQFLIVGDFKDEQAYHEEMLRRHNRNLHEWGVVRDGLQVSKTGDGKNLAISPGSAIDSLGREIVLEKEELLGLDKVQKVAEESPSRVFITIAFRELDSPDDKYPGTADVTRRIQAPKIEVTSTLIEDGTVILLARMSVMMNHRVILGEPNNSVRKLASSMIPRGSNLNLGDISLDGALSFTAKDSPNPTSPQVGLDYDAGSDALRIRARTTDEPALDATHLTIKRETGNVGIGTTSPVAKLHVGSGAVLIGTGAESSFFTWIDSSITHKYGNEKNPRYKIDRDLLDSGQAGIGFGVRNFSIEDGGSAVGIPAYRTLAFYTGDGSKLTERARIDSSGNVGIGTTSPLGPLSVGNSSVEGSDGYLVLGKKNANYTRHCRIGYDSASNFVIGDYGNDNSAGTWKPQFGINWKAPSNSLYINDSGNVGIGTTSPATPLHVIYGYAKTDATARDVATFNSNDATSPLSLRIGIKGDTDANAAKRYASLQAEDGSEKRHLVLQPGGGNVGIGKAGPEHKLDVYGPSGKHPGRVASPDGDLRFGPTNGGWCHFETDRPKFWFNTGITVNTGNIASYGDGDLTLQTGDYTRLTIKQDTGNVGIGTVTPSAKLHVNGSVPSASSQGWTWGERGGGWGGGPSNLSILASESVGGSNFRAFSDTRIKDIACRSDSATDLQLLLSIEVTDYRYKDVIGKGHGTYKKVIGQQVEKVFPQSVSKHTDVVPDIYQQASIQDGWVALATDLKRGERVKLIAEKGGEGVHEVLEVTEDKFRVAFKPEGDKVFVFGREVNDFLTVDYDAISMLNVSATQQLKKEKDEEVKALWGEIAELKAANDALTKRLQLLEIRTETVPNLAAAKKGSNGNGSH